MAHWGHSWAWEDTHTEALRLGAAHCSPAILWAAYLASHRDTARAPTDHEAYVRNEDAA